MNPDQTSIQAFDCAQVYYPHQNPEPMCPDMLYPDQYDSMAYQKQAITIQTFLFLLIAHALPPSTVSSQLRHNYSTHSRDIYDPYHCILVYRDNNAHASSNAALCLSTNHVPLNIWRQNLSLFLPCPADIHLFCTVVYPSPVAPHSSTIQNTRNPLSESYFPNPIP